MMTKTNCLNDDNTSKMSLSSFKRPKILKRQWIIFFTVADCFLMFLLRFNLSVAIISILNEKEPVSLDNMVNFDPVNSNQTEQVQMFKNKYPLSNFMVAQILASFFYGYTVFQLPSGRLSEMLGAKWILGFGALFSAILSFISPFLLDLSPFALIVCRICMGMMQAGTMSCSYTLFAQWLPNKQKANAITLINVGFELGGICSFYLTGYICSIESLGWRYSFYIFSLLCFVWFIPYCFIVYSKPEDDPYLSDYEKELIENERIIEYTNQDFTNKNMIKKPPKLNLNILTSKPVIASCVAKSAGGLIYYMIAIKIPAYLNDVFHMSIESNGTFTALTMAGSLFGKASCFFIATYLIDLKSMSLTNLRKIFQTIAMLIPSISLFILTLKNDNQTLDIFLIVISMFGGGFVCLGDAPITAEFAKDLSGSIFGFTNTWACLAAAVSPFLVSTSMEFFDDKALGWNFVFYVTIVYALISILVFVMFASAEVQPWAESKFEPVYQSDSINGSIGSKKTYFTNVSDINFKTINFSS